MAGQIKSDEGRQWKKSQPGAKIPQSGDTALPVENLKQRHPGSSFRLQYSFLGGSITKEKDFKVSVI